jgi:cytochrome c oxidase subunit IV
MSSTVVSTKVYAAIFGALMALLAVTVGVAYIDLGKFNLAAAMTISIAKTLLILTFFMHLRYGRRLTWVFAGAGFFWLAIMLLLAMSDYATRS